MSLKYMLFNRKLVAVYQMIVLVVSKIHCRLIAQTIQFKIIFFRVEITLSRSVTFAAFSRN